MPGSPGVREKQNMEIKRIEHQKHGDVRGMLISLEEGKNVPFPIRRVYYMFDTKPGVRRGFHAHRHLKQLAIAVRGSVRFHLDDGVDTAEVLLDDPAQGLLLDRSVWREMYDFSDDCVLMGLAAQRYDAGDYIPDYDQFIAFVKEQGRGGRAGCACCAPARPGSGTDHPASPGERVSRSPGSAWRAPGAAGRRIERQIL